MLNFDIYSDKERTEAVKAELSTISKPLTQSQLETMANYILYGKDENGQNAVERGEVQIQTKYNSYKRKQTESLDELIESPVFNEALVQPVHRSVYKNPKPELDKSIPELQPLLESIKTQESLLEDLKNLPQTPEVKTRIYKLNHFLIQLRKEQYQLQEDIKKPIKLLSYNPQVPPPFTDTLTENIGPLGLKIGNLTRFINPKEDKSKVTLANFYDPSREGLNLEDPTHIYFILEAYESLYEKSIDNPFIDAKYLVETIDWYISQVPFDESRLDIIRLKKAHYSNNQIKKYLNRKYGVNYSENYISTIYTKEICKKIAAQVTLHKDKWVQRFEPSVWKKCSCCGQWKLKDAREFVRKKNSEDGFTSRCKMCDRQKKLKRREKEAERRKAQEQAQKAKAQEKA